MGQLQTVRRRVRRRADVVQQDPVPQAPARSERATDEACAAVLARIDDATAGA